MTETTAVAPLKTLLKFPFQGPRWRNHFLIGAALTIAGSIVPILPLVFVNGYVLHIMRQVIKGQDPELPAWDDWGKLGADGLRLMLVGLVYLLPGISVLVGGWLLYMVASFFLPFIAAFSSNQDEGVVVLLVTLSMFGSLAILMLSMFLGSILILLGLIPLPVATAHFVAHDRVTSAFHPREWWRLLKTNRLGYFSTWVVILGLVGLFYLAFMLAYYSLVLCCFVPLLAAPVSFYIALVASALFGQTYRESVVMLGSSAPVPAD